MVFLWLLHHQPAMLLRMLHVLSSQRQAVRQELESLRVKDIDARRTVEGCSLEMVTLLHVYLVAHPT